MAFIPGSETLVDRIRSDPFFRRYVPKWTTQPPSRLSFDDAFGERSIISMLMVSSLLKHDPEDNQTRLMLAERIESAQVFLWRNDIVYEALDLSIPSHVLSPGVLPYEDVYFVFDSPISFGNECLWAVYAHENPKGIEVTWFIGRVDGSTAHPPHRAETRCMDFGERTENFSGRGRSLLALAAFLKSPAIAVSQRFASRPVRREEAKRGISSRPIYAVELRASETEYRRYLDSTETERRSIGSDGWWWVRSFFTTVHYGPGKTLQRLDLRPPQRRGNLNAPQKGRRIYTVSR